MMPMTAVRNIALAGALATASVMTAPAAFAHDALISTNPVAGSVVTTTPQNLELTFSGDIMTVGNQVAVTAADGSVEKITPKVSGAKIIAPLKAKGNGAYSVTWRVTSQDGHPISGSYQFTVKDTANASTSSASSNGGSSSTSTGSAAPSNAMKPGTASTTKGPTTPTTSEPGDNKPWLIGGGVVLALAAIAGLAAVLRRRIKDDPTP